MKVHNWLQPIQTPMPRGGCQLKQGVRVWMALHRHRPLWTPLAQLHHPIPL